MEGRITDKIIEVERYLEELESTLPINFENYKNNWKIKDIFERHFEKIIEAIVDLTFLMIKIKKYQPPKGDQEAIQLLADEGIINESLSKSL